MNKDWPQVRKAQVVKSKPGLVIQAYEGEMEHRAHQMSSCPVVRSLGAFPMTQALTKMGKQV